MPGETARFCRYLGLTKVGVLATEGTVRASAYAPLCESLGMTCLVPTPEEQALISSIIYDRIKQNKPVDMEQFLSVANALRARGCDRLVLGCTELSLLKKAGLDDAIFVDSLEVLAYHTILACGKKPIDFPADFERTER